MILFLVTLSDSIFLVTSIPALVEPVNDIIDTSLCFDREAPATTPRGQGLGLGSRLGLSFTCSWSVSVYHIEGTLALVLGLGLGSGSGLGLVRILRHQRG